MRSIIIMSGEYPPGPGGMGVHAHHLARGLHAQGMEVIVFCATVHCTAAQAQVFDATLPFRVYRYGADAKSWLSLRARAWQFQRLCRLHQAGCLISSGRRASWVVSRVAQALNLPYLAIGHGSEFMEKRPRRLDRTCRAFAAATCVMTHSRFSADLITRAGMGREKIRVIHPGVDLGHPFPEQAIVTARKKELGLEGKRIVLTVGRVSPRKAQDVVIRAMIPVLKRQPEACYLVVGIPAYGDHCLALARELGLAEKVLFVGEVSPQDLPLYYKLCDLCILNSRMDTNGNCEGFGMVLVEAGLAGKPVIGTKHCGIEDAIDNEVTGLLVEPDSPQETAGAILRILDNPALARRLGEAGRNRAQDYFTWNRAAGEVMEIIRPWMT